jgi:hypothetical protein
MTKEQFMLRCSVVCPNYADLFGEGDFFFGDGKNLISLCRDETRRLIWLVGIAGDGLEIARKIIHISRKQGYNSFGFTMHPKHPWHNALKRYLKVDPVFIGPEGNDYLVDLRHGGNRRLRLSE